jgi:hypothetical protein
MKYARFFYIAMIGIGFLFSAAAQIPGDNQDQPPGISPTDLEKENVDRFSKLDEIPVMDEEKSKQISKYFDEALKNYEDILNNRPDAEMKSGEKRIEANKTLLEEQQKKLSGSSTSLRQIKLDYLQRYLSLKNSFEQGHLDKKTYHQQLDKLAKDYAYQIESLKDDVSFHEEQTAKTNERIKELESVQRLNNILMEQNKRSNPAAAKSTPTEPKRKTTELEMLMQRIEAAGCFADKKVGDAPDFK